MPAVWEEELAAARAGEVLAADRLGKALYEWAWEKLAGEKPENREEITIAFAEHLCPDNFGHLAAVPPEQCEGYSHKVLRNCVRDHLREKQRREAREIHPEWTADAEESEPEGRVLRELAESAPSIEAVVILRAQIAAIQAEVARMSAVDQQIFQLRFVEQYSEPEIGEMLGIPTGTVGRHVYKLRKRLRQKLGDDWQ